ncbi:MAG: aspartate-semialdehyde dehydrogenase [Myxococcaceae bacterium]|nr:aspartate-semialdehyde dehydrogenase [Myxococcaceae bacterium]
MTTDRKTRFAVVGATGTVGRELVGALFDAGVPPENLTALASERSEGDELEYGEETLEVEKATPENFRGIHVALFAVPPEATRELALAAQAAGAWVVDVSPTFRSDPEVPMVLPGLNDDVLKSPFKGRIVTTPSPVTAALLWTLEPLVESFGVRRVHATALIAASSEGTRGVAELEKGVADLLAGRDFEPDRFPHRLAFNVIPQVGAFSSGWSAEERAWRDEAARVWEGRADRPLISGTALQIPLFFGHSISLSLDLGRPAEEGEVREALRRSSRLKVLDSPDEKVYPMPMLITADPTVHVGRIRAVPGVPGGFELFAVVDNAGRGAALTAAELALQLASRGT